MDKIVEGYMSDEEEGEVNDDEDEVEEPAIKFDEKCVHGKEPDRNQKTYDGQNTAVSNHNKQAYKTHVSPNESENTARNSVRKPNESCRPLRFLPRSQMLLRRPVPFVVNKRNKRTVPFRRQQDSIVRRPQYLGPLIISFSVKLHLDSKVCVPGEVIKFDNVLMNEGQAYNSSKGTFVCPAAGLYIFMWNISVPVKRTAVLALKINGLMKKQIVAKKRRQDVDQGIYFLKAGDTIWISFCRGCGQICERLTKFGGIRISD